MLVGQVERFCREESASVFGRTLVLQRWSEILNLPVKVLMGEHGSAQGPIL